MYICKSRLHLIAGLTYLGHSEEDTGDWCFKDGTISFQEIFNLYRKNCTNKYLSIKTDCSHSGQWVRECAKTLDNLHIPPCGHRARENRAIVKVFASCQPSEEATEPCYSIEAVTVDDDGCILHTPSQASQQRPIWFNSTKLVCCKGPDSPCPQTTFRHLTWENAVDESWNIRTIERREGGTDMWYYIILHQAGEDYLERFGSQLRTNATLQLSDWGYILESGEGKDIPKIIQNKIGKWTSVC